MGSNKDEWGVVSQHKFLKVGGWASQQSDLRGKL